MKNGMTMEQREAFLEAGRALVRAQVAYEAAVSASVAREHFGPLFWRLWSEAGDEGKALAAAGQAQAEAEIAAAVVARAALTRA